MYRMMTRTLSRIRGNPKALASPLIFFVVLCATIALNYFKPPAYDLMSGALLGAVVSSGVTFLIWFLENPDDSNIPSQFVRGAKRELERVGYYRRDLEIRITLREPERINISFDGRLIPVRKGATLLHYPKIDPPPGLEKVSAKYTVGGEVVSNGTPKYIEGPANELIEIEYKILDRSSSEYSDVHVWLSPVENYEVYFTTPHGFTCQAQERIGAENNDISLFGRQRPGQAHYRQTSSAFSRQGFMWKLSRPA
jgi:hypothetical protein